MTTLKFKTNINCGSCVRSVTPLLNKLPGLDHWEVDTENPDKILTVTAAAITPQDVINAVSKVGFKAEPVA